MSSSSQFQLAGLSSHVEFELMPSFGITHDGSRIVGKPEVIRLLPHRPLIVQLQENDDATKLGLAESVRRGYRRGYGQQAITAVAETLAESIKGAPPAASTYLDLATLIHYEHAAIYADTAPRLRELLIGSPSREQLLRTIRVNWS